MYNKLTETDIEEMEKEIEYRKLVVRPRLLEEVKETRAHGDLSENFEYHAAKKEKNRNESRIRFLEKMIKTARVIEDTSAMDEVGRYRFNVSDGKGGYSSAHTKVGSYLPNAWGLYDMHGNVQEWCLDRWYNYGYGPEAVVDPCGPTTGPLRVLRGGSWEKNGQLCRSAFKDGDWPLDTNNSTGLRVVYLP